MRAVADVPAMFDDLAGRTGELTTHIVGRIRAEVPGYAAFPYAEQHHDVGLGVAAIVEGLRTRRPPTAGAIEHTRAMGRARAAFPLALTDSIEGYHIAYREIWAELLRAAKASEPDLTAEMVGVVALLWTWVHQFSAAFAEAHAEQTREQAANLLARRRRLLDQLTRDAEEPGAAADTAEALGFDPGGPFLAACSASQGEASIERTNTALAAAPGVGHCAAGRPGQALVLAQGMTGADVVAAVHAGEPDAAVGLGAVRSGLRGAAAGIADAIDSLATARRAGQLVDFAHEWPAVVLHRAGSRLDPLLAGGAEVARAQPHLADAVLAFAQHRYSVSGCARALQLHPNSAKYRLERWATLTGWDVYTPVGLAASLACLDRLP